MTRTHWLALTFVILCIVTAVVYWISGWGLITISGKNLKLDAVLKTMSRQSGMEIVTNLAPETTVSVEFDHVPLTQALEIVSARTDSMWQAAWFAAADKATIATALQAYQDGKRSEGWKSFNYPFRGMTSADELPLDPRLATAKLSPMPVSDLDSAFDQLAQKTGQRFILPDKWNPGFHNAPSGGRLTSIVPRLASADKGVSRQVVLLSGFRRNRQGEGGGQQGDGAWMGGGGRRGGEMNQDWIAERIENATAGLSPDEQAKAKAEFETQQKFWLSLRDLTPEERRKKLEELFNNPEVQDRMEQMQAQRDANRSPEQRLNRYRNYIQRKQQNNSQNSK